MWMTAWLISGVVVCALSPTRAVAAVPIKVGGTGAALRSMQTLAEAFQESHPGATLVVVAGLGSRGGKRALVAGAIDMAISADPLKAEEREQGMVAQEYARTPLVFVTAQTNPASAITLQELIDVFHGKITTWSDGRRLRLILRPPGDSDTTTLKSISPAMRDAVIAAHAQPGLKVAVTDQDAADDIAAIPGALGTSTLALIASERRPLKALALNGVVPSVDAVANGSYPYFKSLYVITRPNPAPPVQQFIAFLRSATGRDILVHLGQWVP